MESQALVVGVIAASVKQLGELTRLVRGAGYTVAVSLELRPDTVPELKDVDVWIVNVDLHDEAVHSLFELLEATGTPVIYEDDLQVVASAHSPVSPTQLREQKERRLGAKLRQLVRKSEPTNGQPTMPRAKAVWVIAASTGGPEAVAEFIRGLPGDLSGVALIYAQHMENHGFPNLCQVMSKLNDWYVRAIDAPSVVCEKVIYMVSPEWQFELSEAGVISPLQEPWGGRYRPSIDQVIAKVAKVYRDRAGAIVFTGMGDDGASSCNFMHHRGGKIWVQLPSSCTIDSMPVSVEKKGCVSFVGEPHALAKQFVQLHRSLRLLR